MANLSLQTRYLRNQEFTNFTVIRDFKRISKLRSGMISKGCLHSKGMLS